MAEILLLGTAKVDITPLKPIPLAGYGSRKGNFSDWTRPIYARAFFFEQPVRGGMPRRALFVSADIIWWGSDRIEGLKTRLKERWDLDEGAVVLHGTHSHSGPQTSEWISPYIGKADPEYVARLEELLFGAVEQAEANKEAVKIERGLGTCKFNIYRRKMVDGKIIAAPNADVPVDHDVNVIRFVTADPAQRAKALWVHYTCHSTVTDANLLSTDYPGYAMQRIEEALEGDIVAGFLQGCCGDVRPALIKGDRFYSGTDHEVVQLGETLAKEVLEVIGKPMRAVKSAPLAGKSLKLLLPYEELPSTDQLRSLAAQDTAAGECSRFLLSHPEKIQPAASFDVNMLHVAEGLSLLAMNGEVVSGYGSFIKQRFGDAVLPVPYSNGMIGYVPTAVQRAEGGYEAEGSNAYFYMPAVYDPALERIIQDGIVELAKQIRIV